MTSLRDFDPADFKRRYWQQQPGVFRQVLPHLVEPLSPDELAGLALEPGVDSRVIWCERGRWQLEHGPFDDYAKLGDSHWTLLVQAVNEHYPPARELLRHFEWLPDWRIDDLMMSFATPKGGVGPHVDQYDVFIIQGSGRRQWQIGEPGGLETITPHPELKQVKGFTPIIDVVLEPGDMIYIPAGFPHEGVSIDPSINYSVGFRAPSQAEILSALADKALDEDLLSKRFRDTASSLSDQEQQQSWHLPASAVTAFKNMLTEAVADDELIHRLCATYLSQNPRPPLQFWPEETINETQLFELLEQHEHFLTAPGLRWLTTQEVKTNNEIALYVQGQRFIADAETELLLAAFKAEEALAGSFIKAHTKASALTLKLVLWLVNEGYLVPDDDLEDEEEA
ncbi:MAG TPA: cupin domain-containing protein [Aliidiomarina sp.]|nr:cupin domain-containing protein [Aliidiomarina sp.]